MASVENGTPAEKDDHLIVALKPREAESPQNSGGFTPGAHSIVRDLQQLNQGFWSSRHGKPIVLLLSAVVVVIVINMFGQVWLNRWNGAFFDAIELRDTGEIGRQLVRFIYIVGIMLVLVVAQTWLLKPPSCVCVNG